MRETFKAYMFMMFVAIPAGIIELITLFLGFYAHIWFPFVGWLGFDILLAIFFISELYKDFRYYCPNCEKFFTPWDIKEFIFAKHNILERELTCPSCGEKNWCDEIHKGDI